MGIESLALDGFKLLAHCVIFVTAHDVMQCREEDRVLAGFVRPVHTHERSHRVIRMVGGVTSESSRTVSPASASGDHLLRDRLIHRPKLVKAIIAQRTNAQPEIDLRERWDGHPHER